MLFILFKKYILSRINIITPGKAEIKSNILSQWVYDIIYNTSYGFISCMVVLWVGW